MFGMAQSKDSTALFELKKAYIDFKNKDYQSAYIYFQKMYDQYPKDPTYNYYTGICLLYLDKNPEKALKRLRLAATNDVPDDIYFYLGVAYHNSYLFDDALKNFQWFEKKTTKSKAREYDLQNQINRTINAKTLTTEFYNPSILSREKISKKDLFNLYNIKELDGSFGDRNLLLQLPPDSQAFLNGMYLPNNPERNEIIYFSMRNEVRGDLDIYKSTRKADGTWSEPENAGDKINTPFDENFPYLHTDGSTLYFASKGHYSMGGYDIFKIVWNWEKKQWSDPINEGFPINTPFDDFFFVPSPDEKIAFFSSSRDCEADKTYVYKIKMTSDNALLGQLSSNEIINASKLEINITEKKDAKNEKSTKQPTTNDIVKLETKDSFLYKQEYDSLLNQAMKNQLKADSLKWVIDKKRLQLDNAEDTESQKRITNEIIKLESDIYAKQKIADQCYERVREIEQVNLANNTTTYQVKQEKKEAEPEIKKPVSDSKKSLKDSLPIARLEVPVITEPEPLPNKNESGFYIKTPSVYNEKNPIPVNDKLPKGIIYMIQLGAFSSIKSPASFYGFTPLSCITTPGSKIRKYYTGKFLLLKEAEKQLPKIKEKGFKDAYVVAFNNGKIIPINEAVKAETKQTTTTSAGNQNAQPINQNDLAIQYVLRFELNNQDSILVKKVKSEVPADKKAAFDSKGNIQFISIEWFPSFDEAYALKKELEAIINKEIEIHAFFADSKIPVDQAKKMTR